MSDRADLLDWLLGRLRAEAEGAEARDLPALARQIVLVSRELEQLVPADVSKVDEIGKRRAARRSQAAGS